MPCPGPHRPPSIFKVVVEELNTPNIVTSTQRAQLSSRFVDGRGAPNHQSGRGGNGSRNLGAN